MRVLRGAGIGAKAAGIAGIALAVTACSGDITTVEQAEAQVRVKQQAVDTATEEFAAASAAFCVNAEDYVLALEEMSGTRISVLGVGPERDQVIVRHDLLG